MKTLLFCFITLMLMKFSFSQGTYYPLVEENKLWYTVETGCMTYVQTHISKCEGDTVINNETYKIVFTSWEDNNNSWIKTGYIREDADHKVYYSAYHYDDPSYFEPGMLYDFSAEINDSLTITSFSHLWNQEEIDIVISGIDSVLVDGAFHKRTWFDCGSVTSYWVEGIGSNSGLAEVGFYCTIFCPTCDLQCVKKQGETIYPDGYAGSCFIVGIDEPGTVKTDFGIYPNPANEYFMVIPNSHTNKWLHFDLYNSLGKKEINQYLNNALPTKISTGHLQSGIYLYRISDDNNTVQKGKIVIN